MFLTEALHYSRDFLSETEGVGTPLHVFPIAILQRVRSYDTSQRRYVDSVFGSRFPRTVTFGR